MLRDLAAIRNSNYTGTRAMEETAVLTQSFIAALLAMGSGAQVSDGEAGFVARRLCQPGFQSEILGRKQYELNVGAWIVTCDNGKAKSYTLRAGASKR